MTGLVWGEREGQDSFLAGARDGVTLTESEILGTGAPFGGRIKSLWLMSQKKYPHPEDVEGQLGGKQMC